MDKPTIIAFKFTGIGLVSFTIVIMILALLKMDISAPVAASVFVPCIFFAARVAYRTGKKEHEVEQDDGGKRDKQ